MTYREALRNLLRAGIPNRRGGRHWIFYPYSGGMLTMPDKAKEMSKKHLLLYNKTMNGVAMTRQGEH